MDLKPIICGGTKDLWIQEREQWHSGANFFAVGPGKVIGYGRNVYTMEEMNKNGYEILQAKDIIEGKKDAGKYEKYVVSLDGSELPRGGGGARCMTMPVRRKRVDW
jgi:arginine deiminase